MRLGVRLSSVPRIMTKVLKTVLTSSPEIGKGTSSYIDDILVDTSVVTRKGVISLFSRPAQSPRDWAALGLKICTDVKENLVC